MLGWVVAVCLIVVLSIGAGLFFSKAGKSGGGSRMSGKAAGRIQSAGARTPSGKTGQSGFAGRAQSATANGESKSLYQRVEAEGTGPDGRL